MSTRKPAVVTHAAGGPVAHRRGSERLNEADSVDDAAAAAAASTAVTC